MGKIRILATLAISIAALMGIREAQAVVYGYDDIADTGTGDFLGGQLFGSPVIVEGTSNVAFSGQSVLRTTGIFISGPNGAVQVNQDPLGQPTQQVLEVNNGLSALGVSSAGGLYETSLATTNQARLSFTNYFNRGVNAAIDNSNDVVYVSTVPSINGFGSLSIVGVAPNASPVTIVTPFDQDIPTLGLLGPKIADKGNQAFGPSLIYGENQVAVFTGVSTAVTVDNPLTTQDNGKTVGVAFSSNLFPATTFYTDINGSGQVVALNFVPNHLSNGQDSTTGQIVVTSAQDWNLPPANGQLPTKTLFTQVNTNSGQGPIDPAIAIAKDSTAYAFSAGSSIYEGDVNGVSPRVVATIGQTINGKVVTGIQVTEKNFISDTGKVVFTATFADQTSAIIEASPTLGTWAFSALHAQEICLACLLTVPTTGENGFGTSPDTPVFVGVNPSPHGSVKISAPDGLFFTSLLLSEFTTDDHGQNVESFMLHFGDFSTEVFANELFTFPSLFPGLFSDSRFGIQNIFLDDFTGFPDDNVVLGLTFDTSPQGMDILVQNVPEPGTLALLGAGLGLLALRRGRRQTDGTQLLVRDRGKASS